MSGFSRWRLCFAALQFPIAKSRFVAVSATIPNARDIAEWLGTARGLHIFGEDYRPVRLVTHVRGYNMTKVWQRVMHWLFCDKSNCPSLLHEASTLICMQCGS
jgi:superfamily II RNA helicase